MATKSNPAPKSVSQVTGYSSGGRSRNSESSIRSQLSGQQSARLNKLKKQSQLNELKIRCQEEKRIDKELESLNERSFLAQRRAEEEIKLAHKKAQETERQAIRDREKLQNRLSILRQVRQAEAELQEAELIDSMVNHSNSNQPVESNVTHTTLTTTEVLPPPTQSSVNPPLNNPTSEIQPSPVQSSEEVSIQQTVPKHQATSRTDPTHPSAFPRRQPYTGNTQPDFLQVPAAYHPPSVMPTHPLHLAAPTHPPYLPTPAPTPSTSELLIASTFGVPRPTLPMFSSGRAKDFAVLRMALHNLLDVHQHLSEAYKYQVLLGRLDGPPRKLAEAYLHDITPYRSAIQALKDKYGQPRQLVQSETAFFMNMAPVRVGDSEAFDNLSLAVHRLAGMLQSIEGENGYELRCGSHVDRLMGKLPPANRDSFVEYCLNKGIIGSDHDQSYTLIHFSEWLKTKALAKRISSQATTLYRQDPPTRTDSSDRRSKGFQNCPNKNVPTAVFNIRDRTIVKNPTSAKPPSNPSLPYRTFCAFCSASDHHLSVCQTFKTLSTDDKIQWIRSKNRCWKCARTHDTEQCNLKKPCHICNEIHLTVLHDTVQTVSKKVYSIGVKDQPLYVDQPSLPHSVMLKIVPVLLSGPQGAIETFAVLDDGSQRTMIMTTAVKRLGLQTKPDNVLLTTIRRESFTCKGETVNLEISPRDNPNLRLPITGAFSSEHLCLSEYTYPVESLQQQWQHLQVATLPEVNRATPLILVGSDHADLILPMQPIQFGPTGTPVAVCTKLGWSLQGPSPSSQGSSNPDRCLLTSTKPLLKGDLLENVARLWQIDVLPYTGKDVTRSKQDKQAITTLDSGTVKIDVDGETHYATPLLRKQADAQLSGSKGIVIPYLKRTERRLEKQPNLAEIHRDQIHKLVDAGYVKAISDEKAEATSESWYIPHHVVKNNDKHRLVFNCSFEHNGESLNSNLLPGPTLGSSLLGVFLRFRQHAVAVTGDIKAMFHQIRLLPEDRPLLRFLWRDMKREETPIVYEWQVLPFGTTCSPCCATFALQKHVMDNIEGNEDVARCINQAFYVDNCLDSTPTVEEAQQLVSKTRSVLAKGGLNIRQWASNIPDVVKDLPPESRSDNCELWLNFGRTGETQEPTLGLRWQCDTDAITYRYRPIEYTELTMRVIYPTLATQYDPIGYLCPFTARAKILVQELWKGQTSWEKVITSGLVYEAWMKWEGELPQLPQIRLPGCYTPHNLNIDNSSVIRQLHIFCDASERIYGSVAYLRSEDVNGTTGVSFVAARSRVAPKKQLSIPRLELCAALTGAQLAEMLSKELTVSIDSVNLWSDSTTVLTWLLSDSCQYKVFVGTRVSEIQNLTDINNWRYVNTKDNPADDITCGKTLAELCGTSRWQSGPLFLCDKPERWPNPRPTSSAITEDTCELKKTFCLTATVEPMPEFLNYHTWDLLVTATMQLPDGAASSSSPCMSRRQQAEVKLYRQVQTDSFSEDLTALMAGKPVQSSSKLLQLDPEYDRIDGMIRVGGRLRQVDILPHSAKHPIVLDPKHHITRLIIKDYDEKLLHAGAERILAETRRFFLDYSGKRSYPSSAENLYRVSDLACQTQHTKRADLPLARLRLFRPSFFSTGVDCFGPMRIKIGRRNEKRWGILFKCMTSRAVNLDLLDSMDADSFLMAFRRFISHRGKPSELLSDCGTNFKGGETELLEAFNAMKPEMANQLEKQVKFQFNPPYAPHFGGAWEREIRSVKNGLKVTLGDQSVTEPVLRTVLIEIEGILNSKPLGYVPTDISDAEPVTPNVLLMGRRDPSLPQVVYPQNELLGRRRWRHSQVLPISSGVTFSSSTFPPYRCAINGRRTVVHYSVVIL